jgi:hypothetical protein
MGLAYDKPVGELDLVTTFTTMLLEPALLLYYEMSRPHAHTTQ